MTQGALSPESAYQNKCISRTICLLVAKMGITCSCAGHMVVAGTNHTEGNASEMVRSYSKCNFCDLY